MKYFLIDCDTGIDDSIAILFALKRPDVKVVGITTGCGNCSAAQAAENTLRLIKLADVPYHVPVAIGENKPLYGEWGGPVPHIHGKNGIGDVELPPSDQQPEKEHASDFIVRLAHEYAGRLTVITLGRMTNFALAIQKDPEIVKLVRNVVFMGGTWRHVGNVMPLSEANIFGDPEAADMVINAGFSRITMVGLDVTMRTRLSTGQVDLMVQYAPERNRAVVSYIRKALDFYYGYYRAQNYSLDHCPVHDPLAVVLAVCPQLGRYRKYVARVECKGEYTRGMIVTDDREFPIEGNYLTICTEVETTRAVETLLAAFCHDGAGVYLENV